MVIDVRPSGMYPAAAPCERPMTGNPYHPAAACLPHVFAAVGGGCVHEGPPLGLEPHGQAPVGRLRPARRPTWSGCPLGRGRVRAPGAPDGPAQRPRPRAVSAALGGMEGRPPGAGSAISARPRPRPLDLKAPGDRPCSPPGTPRLRAWPRRTRRSGCSGSRSSCPWTSASARVAVNVRKAPFGGMILDRGGDLGLVPDQGVICPGRRGGPDLGGGPDPGQPPAPGRLQRLHRGHAGPVPGPPACSRGLGPGKAAIRYIGAQEMVQVGEPVFTSGLDRIFPRGLLVGYVSDVRPPGRGNCTWRWVLAAPLDRLGLVLILPPPPADGDPAPGRAARAVPGTAREAAATKQVAK